MCDTLLFDWGNTIMIDYPDQKGPMYKWKNVEPVKNAQEVLSALSKSCRCYLVTNAKDSSKNEIVKALYRAQLDIYFTDIFCHKEFRCEKPSKEFFDKVIHIINNPPQCLMVGDNLQKDIVGAKNS
jgi:putative hydrolase of the HAD superfamily